MNDVFFVLRWWVLFFCIGLVFLPTTTLIFRGFADRGYIFSKTIGIALISYVVFFLGTIKLLPFTNTTIYLVGWIFLLFNVYLYWKKPISIKNFLKYAVAEEILFFVGIALWSYVRAHEPSIHSLEKFMDFGFINSILRSTYFPPRDMWFTPFSINYYYFGHLTTAVLTKLAGIPSSISYNLMLATIFALTFVSSFSIGSNLIHALKGKRGVTRVEGLPTRAHEGALAGGKPVAGPRAMKLELVTGVLSALLVTFSGNLHTLYALFAPYKGENPVPFWTLPFLPISLPNNYWYANATRFIPFTIHEFPSYSFIVADLHGHVLDIPFVLLSLAFLLVLYEAQKIQLWKCILFGFFLAVMYMTNAWDGLIYFLAAAIVLFLKYAPAKSHTLKQFFKNFGDFFTPFLKHISLVLVSFILFSLPFNFFFQSGSIVHGIGIVCPPQFLVNVGRVGPFLFEANHCQRSPWWQLLILYGFFYLFVGAFSVVLWRKKRHEISRTDTFISLLIVLATILIILPEFFYVKDIYPAHYRANTMFKLVYQAFIMLSFASSYIISTLLETRKKLFVLIFILLFFVIVYPYFGLKSYYQIPPEVTANCTWSLSCAEKTIQDTLAKDAVNYKGLDGTLYLKNSYPADYDAISWINKYIKGQPVILEAQGDSYTDYARISANTGLPTVLGWTVHEWLWRGSYDVPAPRIEEVRRMYESRDLSETQALLKKDNVEYVYIGALERQKYTNLSEEKFTQLGKAIFQKDNSRLYKLY